MSSSDPFLHTSDTGALRTEIRRLQQENLMLKQTTTQQKMKLQELAVAESAAGGSSGKKKGGSSSSSAAALKQQSANSNSAADGGNGGEYVTGLKSEITRLKKELNQTHVERDKLAAERDQHQQILEAVAVAACEREQRLRNMCVELEVQVRASHEKLQTTMTMLRAQPTAPPPPAAAPAVLPPPAAPSVPSLPLNAVEEIVEDLRSSLLALEALVSGAAHPEKKTSNATTRGKRQGPRDSGTATTSSSHRHQEVLDKAEELQHHSAASSSDAPTVVAPSINTASSSAVAAASLPDLRPRKRTTSASIAGSTSTREPQTKQRRVEQQQQSQMSSSALSESVKNAVERHNAKTTSSNSNNGTAAAVGDASAVSSSSPRSLVHFSEDIWSDVFELHRKMHVSTLSMELSKLAKQVFLHFDCDVKRMCHSLVRHVASVGQQWMSSNVFECRRRAVVFSETLLFCCGKDGLREWIGATGEFFALLMDVDHIHTDYSSQIIPVALCMSTMTNWWRQSSEQQLQQQRGGVDESVDNNNKDIDQEILESQLLLMSSSLLAYLRTARREGGELRLLDATDEESQVSVRQMLVLAKHLFDSGESSTATSTAATITSSRGGPLWLTVQAIVGDLVSTRKFPISEFNAVCDAIGWSQSRLPLDQMLERFATAAMKAAASPLTAKKASSRLCELILSLRLLVLYQGLPQLEKIHGVWFPQNKTSGGGIVVTSTPSAAASLAALLSFVVNDFDMRDERDAEWVNTIQILEAYLQEASSKSSSTVTVPSTTSSWVEVCVAAALTNMSVPHQSHVMHKSTGSAISSSSPLVSDVKRSALLHAMKWWLCLGNNNAAAVLPAATSAATSTSAGKKSSHNEPSLRPPQTIATTPIATTPTGEALQRVCSHLQRWVGVQN